jgi:hypothetical protein
MSEWISKMLSGGSKRPDVSAEEAQIQAEIKAMRDAMPQEFVEDKWLQDLQLEQLGQLPELQQTEMANISLDPRMRQAQMEALQRLQGLSKEGYGLEDKAAIQGALNDQAMQERAQRQAVMQNMQARGMGGSGAELAQQLSAQQGGANRASQQTTDLAVEGRRRALEAMMQGAGLAGRMESQDFDRASQIAQAKDAVNRFNTQNQVQRAYHNNDVVNQGLQYNNQGRQGVHSANSQGQNQFGQNRFQNQAQVSGVAANDAAARINQKVDGYNQKKASEQGIIKGLLGGAAKIGAAYAGRPPKKDEEE